MANYLMQKKHCLKNNGFDIKTFLLKKKSFIHTLNKNQSNFSVVINEATYENKSCNRNAKNYILMMRIIY